MTAERKNGITELMVACSRGELARAEALVAGGEDVNARDRFGHTPLMYAAGAGHASVVEMLLSSGADAGAKNQNNLTAFELAAARGHRAVAELLRDARFFHAARDGDVRLLTEMIDSGANVNAVYPGGWTALMTAALYDRHEVAAALIARGADPRLQNDTGWTALLIAERKGHARTVAVLGQGRPESPWGALPPADKHFEVEDVSPLIEAPDHHDA
jgi:ankyrin repeat protein